jgi:D-serine deaminase-like pyridoxal phosphate-dependent protein
VDPADPCLTVSTLAEARFFFDGGFSDICWALPLAPCHMDSALDLARECADFSVLVDHPQTIAGLQQRAAARSQRISTWLKIDCGYHRAGVDPGDPQSLESARALSESPWTNFRGLLAHGGHGYRARSMDEIIPIAQEERDQTLSMAERLRASGVELPALSIGSTPTMRAADHLRGINEIRPGNYIFFDLSQVSIGSCGPEEIAVSVLSTVIGRYPGRHTALIDAGGLALSKDAGDGCQDFGEILDLEGRVLAGLRLTGLSQEHGKIRADPGVPLPPIHSQLRIRPNHSCLSAALFPEYRVHQGMSLVDTWRPVRGWTQDHGRR